MKCNLEGGVGSGTPWQRKSGVVKIMSRQQEKTIAPLHFPLLASLVSSPINVYTKLENRCMLKSEQNSFGLSDCLQKQGWTPNAFFFALTVSFIRFSFGLKHGNDFCFLPLPPKFAAHTTVGLIPPRYRCLNMNSHFYILFILWPLILVGPPP